MPVSQGTSPSLKIQHPSALLKEGVAARSVYSAYSAVDVNNGSSFIMGVVVFECIVFSSRLACIQVVICSCVPEDRRGNELELKPATRVIAGNRGRSRGCTCAVPLKCFASRLCFTPISRPMRRCLTHGGLTHTHSIRHSSKLYSPSSLHAPGAYTKLVRA